MRLEFFGNELESLREFDPQTQVSREQVDAVTLPPAGELSVLQARQSKWDASVPAPPTALGCFLDYLPDRALLVLSDPDALSDLALRYAQQVPEGDPFFVPWLEFLAQVRHRGLTQLELHETEEIPPGDVDEVLPAPAMLSLDPFRPIGATLPEATVAETQRREFFQQMHRWLRQGFAVHVFCKILVNNDGTHVRSATTRSLMMALPANLALSASRVFLLRSGSSTTAA